MNTALNLIAVTLFVVLGIFFFRIRYGIKPERDEGDPVHIGIMMVLTLGSVVALAEGVACRGCGRSSCRARF